MHKISKYKWNIFELIQHDERVLKSVAAKQSSSDELSREISRCGPIESPTKVFVLLGKTQLRTVGFWLCLVGRWRLFSALSIPFSSDVSLGEVSWSAALARSLAASMNLSVLSFASNPMVFSKPSIKSYTNKAEMSSNPPEPDARGNRPSLSTTTAWSSHCSDIREQLGNPQSIQKNRVRSRSGTNAQGFRARAQPEKCVGYFKLHATSAVFREADPEIVGYQSLFVWSTLIYR